MRRERLLCLVLGLLLTPTVHGQVANPKLYVFADIGDGQLGLINTQTDQLVQVDVAGLPGWPGNGIVHKQHAWVTPDGKTVYMSIDAMAPSPAGIVVFNLNDIDWDNQTADVTIKKTLEISPPGESSNFPAVEQVDPRQPIAHWTQPAITQVHGPSFRPHSPFSYATIWTDDRIVAFNYQINNFTWFGPTFSYGDFSRHTHGLVFNSHGNLALGTGYYYDQTSIDVYFFYQASRFPFRFTPSTCGKAARGGHLVITPCGSTIVTPTPRPCNLPKRPCPAAVKKSVLRPSGSWIYGLARQNA
ncbi:MAG TPA: hypothetical protein DCY79_03930 [Planctomycetaceae bacterium]|nr:hypothetical protein [Planctomycetaceae bacterium]